MEAVRHFLDRVNDDVGWQVVVQYAADLVGRPASTSVHAEVRHLCDRVNACVGASRAMQFDFGSEAVLHHLLEIALHCACIALFLPAAILGAVVFERQLPGLQMENPVASATAQSSRLFSRALATAG